MEKKSVNTGGKGGMTTGSNCVLPVSPLDVGLEGIDAGLRPLHHRLWEGGGGGVDGVLFLTPPPSPPTCDWGDEGLFGGVL